MEFVKDSDQSITIHVDDDNLILISKDDDGMVTAYHYNLGRRIKSMSIGFDKPNEYFSE